MPINKIKTITINQAGATDGQSLVWSSTNSQWQPGGGGGSYADSDVDTHLNTGTATANQVLSWNGSDYAWVADQTGSGGLANIVEDTSPQLGGDLDLLAKNIVGNGNIDINGHFHGTNIELETIEPTLQFKRLNNANVPTIKWLGQAGVEGANIKFDGTNGNTNQLIFETYDNTTLAERFRVTYDGISVTDHIALADDGKAKFGDDGDLEIYHNGTDSYIDDAGTGSIFIRSGTTYIQNAAGTKTSIQTNAGAGQTLYYNNNQVFVTTSTGVDVIGTAVTDGVTVDGTLKINEVIEKAEPSNSTSGTIDFYFLDQAIINFLQNQTANRTINFGGNGSTTLASMLSINESVTCTILMPQGATPYYLDTYQIDGSAVTPKWISGTAPTAGNASGIDVYTFTIIKTPTSTFTVLASMAQYA